MFLARTHTRTLRETSNAEYPTSNRNAGGGARTHTILRSLDFESSASASSATPARRGKNIGVLPAVASRGLPADEILRANVGLRADAKTQRPTPKIFASKALNAQRHQKVLM